jgi:cell division protein FtsL
LAELRRRRDRRTIGERVYLVALIVVTVVCIFILATNGALA